MYIVFKIFMKSPKKTGKIFYTDFSVKSVSSMALNVGYFFGALRGCPPFERVESNEVRTRERLLPPKDYLVMFLSQVPFL